MPSVAEEGTLMVQHGTSLTNDHRHISIRPMRRADLDAVVALDASVHGEARPAYFERRLATLDHLGSSNQPIFLVAEQRDTVVGFVMGTLAYGEFGLTQITALVDSIAIDRDYQHKGVGQRLAQAFVQESARQGAAAVYTLVNWEAWDLLKFFRSLGFSLASTIPLELRID